MKRVYNYVLGTIFLLFLGCSLNAIQKCHNLVMVLDPYKEETKEGGFVALSVALGKALIEKVAPIITTPNILENICFWKLNEQKLVETESLHKILWFKSLIDFIELNDDDWYCYIHEPSFLVVLIPKMYLEYHTKKLTTDMPQKLKECGFNSDALDKIESISPEYILNYFATRNKQSTPQDCLSLFMIPKDNEITWNTFLIGHGVIPANTDKGLFPGAIAGLAEKDFAQLIEVFQKIKTSFLYCNSCFSGGYNQYFIKNIFNRKKVDFIAISQGINESVTYITPNWFFADFFSLLADFFGVPEQFTKERKKKIGKSDPLALIAKSVNDDASFLDYNQPFVYFPSVGIFNALTIDKSVKILTKTKAKAHEFEGKAIDFTHPDIQTIIVYPHLIGVPINIKDHVAIVAPTQQIFPRSPTEKNLYVFEEVYYDAPLSSVIPNFVSFNSSLFPIVFVMKKLHCKNYPDSGIDGSQETNLILENVIILLIGNRPHPWQTIDTAIMVLFEYQDKNYYLSQSVSNLSNNSNLLFEAFKNAKASLLQAEELDSLLPYLVDNEHIATIKKNDITLTQIVKQLEQKVDTPFRVQKIGSLQKVLERKQQDAASRRRSWSELFHTYIVNPLSHWFGKSKPKKEIEKPMKIETSPPLPPKRQPSDFTKQR